MKNRAKEKNKKIDTKDKNILNLDNEIIIGIKSLPKVQKNTKQSQEKKKKNITTIIKTIFVK